MQTALDRYCENDEERQALRGAGGTVLGRVLARALRADLGQANHALVSDPRINTERVREDLRYVMGVRDTAGRYFHALSAGAAAPGEIEP